MYLSTHHKTCENPKLQQKKNQEKAMEKLREGILKISNSEPNVPLSETQNSILQQHLNKFLSDLRTTPVHPPYAWMIEQALQELDEEGGSNENSISEFIKKKYDSLPRAHTTMLKHHLQKMSEKGEIVMIDGGRFLLPDDRAREEGNSSIDQKKPQKIKQRRGRPAKYKEDGAKIDDSTTSALATNEEVLDLDDPQDKRRGRALKGKEDGADPDTILLKDLKLTKKQKNQGLGRHKKAQ